jgi:iron complex outermembrane receptor protein
VGFASPAVSVGSVIEEVVVTAQKRPESSQDVGISITAFDADQIRALGFTDSADVAAMSPGVQVNHPNGLSSLSFSVRGVTQSDFSDHHEAPVSVYVDEVYVSQMSAAGFQLFDIERVETLRGPQGTLFGRNATGGLVHFVTRRPADNVSAYADVTFGDFNLLSLESAVGGPVAEGVSARASIKVSRHDGYIDNRSGPDGNEQKDYAGRLQVLFALGENGNLLLNVRGARNDVDAPQFWKNAAATVGPNGVGVFTDGDVRGDVHAGSWNLTGGWDIESYGVSATLTWDFADFQLTSITDYSDVAKMYLADADEGIDSTLLHFGADDAARQVSQEVRISNRGLGGIDWVAGLYFLDVDGDYASSFVAPGTLAFLGLAPLNAVYNEFSTETTSWAAFTQADFEILPGLTATVGIRWTEDDKEFDYSNNLAIVSDTLRPLSFAPDGLVPIGAFNTRLNDDRAAIDKGMWSAKAALSWVPVGDLLYYLSWNRGIKGGSFNAPVFVLPVDEMKFDEEVLDAYEIGMKSSFLRNRLRLNAAAFYYDYGNIQAYQLEGFTQVIRNRDGETAGAEVEIAASPVDGLDLLLGISYLDATIEDVSAGFATIDARPQMAPEWNVSGLFRYRWRALGGTIAVQGDFNFLDEHFFDISNSDVVTQDAYLVGNARLSYRTGDEKVEASAFVNNVGDKAYATWAYDIAAFAGVIEKSYGMPRWWGVSLRYSID